MDMRDASQARFTPPHSLSSMRRRVPGLRDEAPASEVEVFKLNPDGSKGELLRTEPAYPANKKRYGDGF